MIRWEGPGGPKAGTDEARAQPLEELQAGDFVTVWCDPFNRKSREGTARLLKFRRNMIGRAPLAVWSVRLETLHLPDSRGELRPVNVETLDRIVHPADRLARGEDVPERPRGAPQLSLEELDPERRR